MAFTETSTLLKYLLRNFPNATAIFDNYVKTLAKLLPSKKVCIVKLLHSKSKDDKLK